MLKEANSSPSTVRSATLPRNAYLTSPTSNQMTIHNNDESMASFNGHTQDHHPQYNHHHHHQYNIKQHLVSILVTLTLALSLYIILIYYHNTMLWLG